MCPDESGEFVRHFGFACVADCFDSIGKDASVRIECCSAFAVVIAHGTFDPDEKSVIFVKTVHLQPEGDEPRCVVETFVFGVLADVVADFSRFGVEGLAEKKLFEQFQRFPNFIVVFSLEAVRDE